MPTTLSLFQALHKVCLEARVTSESSFVSRVKSVTRYSFLSSYLSYSWRRHLIRCRVVQCQQSSSLFLVGSGVGFCSQFVFGSGDRGQMAERDLCLREVKSATKQVPCWLTRFKATERSTIQGCVGMCHVHATQPGSGFFNKTCIQRFIFTGHP